MRLVPRARSLAPLAAPLLALWALSSPALADTVFLKDGRRLDGSVSHREGKLVVTLRPGVEVLLDPGEVDRVEVGESLREAFERKKSDLVPGDPEPRYALAVWCKASGLATEWRAMLEDVLRLDPDHAQARRDLGFVKDAGKWIPEEELRHKLGFEKLDGRWVPAAEAKRAHRTAEVRKLLLKIAFDYRGPRGVAARASLDALAADPEPALIAPLVEERLGDHDASVRHALTELLGKLKQKSSAPRLAQLVFEEQDPDVVASAARGLWATGDVAGRTTVVQNLFHKKSPVRDRAADALSAANDPETIPYLIEGLYLRAIRTVAVTEPDEQVIVRGAGELPANGRFGGYHQPVIGVMRGETVLRQEEVFISAHHALAALQKMTGKNFEFLKSDWYEWWTKEGRAQLIPAPVPPAPGAPAPGAPAPGAPAPGAPAPGAPAPGAPAPAAPAPAAPGPAK